jgi:ABC-type phosphate/phosphonate transport system substrate-binding protein
MMKSRHPLMVCAALALTLLVSTLLASEPGSKSERRTFQIGISDALIRGQTTPSAALIQVQPMAELFSIMNSVKPEFQFDNPEGLAKSLKEGKVQLAVMPGIEFGWLGDKAKELTPLAVAYTCDIKLKAYIIARADSKAAKLTDLRGKKLAMAKRTQHHTQVFVHDSISRSGSCPKSFFAGCTLATDADAAIEAVLEGDVAAVAIDSHSWDVFKERKPGRARKLAIVAESACFPTAVLVHKPGMIPEDQLKTLRDGLMTAHQKPFCRQILNFWRISQFVPYTPEYDQVVKNAVKSMPEPIIPVQFAKPN